MTIALTALDLPAHLNHAYSDFRRLGYAIVRAADLSALEEAKLRYELAFCKDHGNIHPRSQRDSAPVEQSESPAQPPTDPALEHIIEHTHTINGIKLKTTIRTQTYVLGDQ